MESTVKTKAFLEDQKEKAVEFMKKLNIYKPYIYGFKTMGKVCHFENFGGFWVDQDPKLEKKMHEIEEKYDCVVYAITHNKTHFGEMYSFLIVTSEPEEWDDLVYPLPELNEKAYGAFAYVWNVDDDDFSEFGDVTLQCLGGGIRRAF